MIEYVIGDATDPQGEGHKIIVHCCNDEGKWGAGFVLALSKKWPQPEREFLSAKLWAERYLGRVQFVTVQTDIEVANLFGQHGTRYTAHKRPVKYDAISDGFDTIAKRALSLGSSIHMPRLGCGLAGGDWRIIELLAEESFVLREIPVTVYDLVMNKEKQ